MRFAKLKVHSGELLRLDLLRFIASAGIVWHHSHEFFYAPASRAAASAESQALALFVDLFFVISGFVIAYVYDGRIGSMSAFGRFMQRRVGRLVPLHLLTLFLAWMFWLVVTRMGVVSESNIDITAGCIARTALLAHAIIPCTQGVPPNAVSWSISTEMLLYLLFPLFALLLRRRIALGGLFALTLAGAVAYAVRTDTPWDHVYAPLRGMPSFLLGMLLYSLRERLARVPVGSAPALAVTAVMIVLMSTGVSQLIVLATVYLVAALTVAADMHAPPGRRITLLAPLGQLTYSMYMWHSLIIIVLMNAIGDKLLKLSVAPMIALALVCYAVIFVVSYLSWTLVETPARKWIDSL